MCERIGALDARQAAELHMARCVGAVRIEAGIPGASNAVLLGRKSRSAAGRVLRASGAARFRMSESLRIACTRRGMFRRVPAQRIAGMWPLPLLEAFRWPVRAVPHGGGAVAVTAAKIGWQVRLANVAADAEASSCIRSGG